MKINSSLFHIILQMIADDEKFPYSLPCSHNLIFKIFIIREILGPTYSFRNIIEKNSAKSNLPKSSKKRTEKKIQKYNLTIEV